MSHQSSPTKRTLSVSSSEARWSMSQISALSYRSAEADCLMLTRDADLGHCRTGALQVRGGRRPSAIETFFFFASLGDEVATLWTNFDLSLAQVSHSELLPWCRRRIACL